MAIQSFWLLLSWAPFRGLHTRACNYHAKSQALPANNFSVCIAVSPSSVKDMGSCSFAGLSKPGSFLQLLSLESGFCSRPGTTTLGAAGLHMSRPAPPCAPLSPTAPTVTKALQPSVTLQSAACSHMAYTRMHKEEEAELVCCISAIRALLCLKRKTYLLEEIPWNQSFSPQVSNTGPLEALFGHSHYHFTFHSANTLHFYHQKTEIKFQSWLAVF